MNEIELAAYIDKLKTEFDADDDPRPREDFFQYVVTSELDDREAELATIACLEAGYPIRVESAEPEQIRELALEFVHSLQRSGEG